jgi:hypothetical protein
MSYCQGNEKKGFRFVNRNFLGWFKHGMLPDSGSAAAGMLDTYTPDTNAVESTTAAAAAAVVASAATATSATGAAVGKAEAGASPSHYTTTVPTQEGYPVPANAIHTVYSAAAAVVAVASQ